MFRSPPTLFNQSAPFLRFAFFVILSFAFIFSDHQLQATESIRSFVQKVLAPIQLIINKPSQWLASGAENIQSMSSMKDLINKQTEQIKDLTLIANHAENLNAENSSLRKLLSLQQQTQFKTLSAEIIFNPNNPASQKLVVNRGALHGLKLGMPVASDAGIMGQVTRVFENSSEVTLLEEKDFTIPIQVARNGLRGALFGAGRAQPLELRYISALGELDVGDYLTTSGIDGTYPPGFPVAMISKIDRSPDNSGAIVICLPLANLNRDRHLIILLYQPQTEAPQPLVPDPIIGKRVLRKKEAESNVKK
ncbi:MAG: rod shape-determining protein MreC [Betaproteobacteria bacterium]